MKKIRVLIIVLLLIFGVKSVFAFDNSGKIYDYAHVLKEKEEIKIKKEIDKYISKYNLDMVIVTVKHYTQNSLEEYMKEFYTKNEFGLGNNKDGIMIVLDFKGNLENIQIKTFGLGDSLYSGNEIENILNKINKEDKYNNKFLEFINYSNKYINENEDIYNTNNNIFNDINWMRIIVFSIIITTIITTIIIRIVLLKNKKYKKEYNINYYIKNDSVVINKKDTKFKTTKTKKERII